MTVFVRHQAVLWLRRSRMFIETGREHYGAPAERNVSDNGTQVRLPFRSDGARMFSVAFAFYKHSVPTGQGRKANPF
jgi:hypothetical protein